MTQTDRENIVMGYAANEVAAFAVLCNEAETGVLDAKIDAEISARAAADTAEATARSAADTAEATARAAADTAEATARTNADNAEIVARTAAIAALTFFKSIGGVQAGANDDTLAVTGSGGISVTGNQANKKIDIDASWHKSHILALEAWNNSSANAAKVASWMEQLPAGSYLKNKYLITELAQPSETGRAVAYWNAMLASIPSRTYYAWVAYDSENMCLVRPGNAVPISGQEYTLATVYLPHKESCMLLQEIYTGRSTVSGVAVMDGEINWSVVTHTFFGLQTEVSARAEAVTAEATARANAVTAEATTRAAADSALGGRCTQLEYELTDADMVEIMA